MGVMEQTKGKLKEAAGDLTDNDALKTEGSAQADKGAEERKGSGLESSRSAEGLVKSMANSWLRL